MSQGAQTSKNAAATVAAGHEQQQEGAAEQWTEADRQAAFSGTVLERLPGASGETAGALPSASSSYGNHPLAGAPAQPEGTQEKVGVVDSAADAEQPITKKVSQFKQQRAGA